MKRSYYIRLSTILGLSIIILIQCIWLYTSYTFARNELSVRMTDMLEQAMMEESFSRIHQLPFGTRVQGRTEKDRNRNIPEFVYMQEALEELNKPISLDTLSHIYKLLLQNNKYPQECVLTIADTQHIIQQTEGELPFSFFTLKSDKVPLRKDHSITIQAQIINPNNLYFQKMGLLLISTTILVALVIACIIYQINIIARMNKIIRVREDFFHALVHDMKTPLNCISMTLTALYKKQFDRQPQIEERYYKIGTGALDKLLSLTEKVLTIMKLESGKMELNKKRVELQPLVEKVTEKFEVQDGDKPIEFTLDLQAKYVYADEEMLEEVFNNLIENAIKYSNESVDIRISSENEEKRTAIRVRDNGLGIGKQYLQSIFNKYERGAADRRVRSGGATGFGIGLNFVQQVVAAHEGDITATSREKEFTEFTIHLPNIYD